MHFCTRLITTRAWTLFSSEMNVDRRPDAGARRRARGVGDDRPQTGKFRRADGCAARYGADPDVGPDPQEDPMPAERLTDRCRRLADEADAAAAEEVDLRFGATVRPLADAVRALADEIDAHAVDPFSHIKT
jgi:hypothetical protein